MKIKQILESTAGSTSSGSVASVAKPLGKVQKRTGNLFKGKKTSKPFYEQQVKEDEIVEQDLIIVPGQRRLKDTSFIPHEKDRRDHEVEMARSDLYAAAKDAMRIYKLIKARSEMDGLMGWQQSYITLAADYLNSVADSLEHELHMTETGYGVIAAGGVGESEYMSGSESQFVPSATLKALDDWLMLSTQRDTAIYFGQRNKARQLMKQIDDLEEKIVTMKKGASELQNWKMNFKTRGPKLKIAEKSVSKAQQKFMGMVHAAQKGEKPASPEVAKVAKSMPKKAAKDFAKTKHKGLPEKVKKK
jgi:hypothetical protein